MPVLDPLLSEFWNEGQSEFWWLLDSGASATVMATSAVNAYGAWVADMKHEQCRAANGSRVDIDGTATISVWVGFHNGRDKNWIPDYKSAKFRSLWLKFSVQVTSSRAHLLQRRVLVTA